MTSTAITMATCIAGGAGGGLPAGVILAYGASAAPAGYLLCDGSAVSRATYATLFAAINTTWGVGDGSTTFGLPDLRGRMAVGQNATVFANLAAVGGAESVTPTGTVSAPTFTGTAAIATNAVSAGTPAGSINAHTTAADSTTTGGTAKVTGPGTHTFTGSALGTHQHTLTPAGTNSAPTFTGGSHTNLPPYVVTQYIIKT